jgi:hypothetical protein
MQESTGSWKKFCQSSVEFIAAAGTIRFSPGTLKHNVSEFDANYRVLGYFFIDKR